MTTRLWVALAAAALAACAGGDHEIDADRDGYIATLDCDDARSDRWQLLPAYADLDGDHVGDGALLAVCSGASLAEGHAPASGDCAPLDAARWQERGYLHRDADGDGATVSEAGTVCAGHLLPPGYRADPGLPDCDDGDRWRFVAMEGWPDADRDGVGAGAPEALCTAGTLPPGWATAPGDCAPEDQGRWRMLAYDFADGDGDGVLAPHAGEVCAGLGLPPGHATVASTLDCDDGARERWATWLGYPDPDGDGAGEGEPERLCIGASPPATHAVTGADCAPGDPGRWRMLSYAYRDADGDGFTVGSAGTVCAGAALPPGHLAAPAQPDCDDGAPLLHTALASWPDADGDGVGAGAGEVLCTGGARPAGWVATGTDCAADDRERWQLLAAAGTDVDGDGWTTRASASVCSGAALPEPYRAAARGNDCDDGATGRWAFTVLYADADGDGVGAPPRSIACLGADLPPGVSLLGFDPDDGDDRVSSDDAVELITEVF